MSTAVRERLLRRAKYVVLRSAASASFLTAVRYARAVKEDSTEKKKRKRKVLSRRLTGHELKQ